LLRSKLRQRVSSRSTIQRYLQAVVVVTVVEIIEAAGILPSHLVAGVIRLSEAHTVVVDVASPLLPSSAEAR
jgi:hypothetical protein